MSDAKLTPARRPERGAIAGRHVRLEPLSAAHGAALFRNLGGTENAGLWTYMADGPFLSRADFDAAMARRAAGGDPLFFAIAPQGGEAVGIASLMRIDAGNGVIEVGGIVFGATLAQSAAATEAIYLLAGYVFDGLGYRRLEWKCDDRNAASKQAAARFGFRYEGLFRQHMVVKGGNRDTAWFSMLDREWPARKAAFETWLAPENFDASGRQRQPLARD